MYGLSDQPKPIPAPRFSALRQGSSRYSTPISGMIEHTFAPVEVAEGIVRVTYPMPMKPGHVHGYLVPTDDGYLLVDTGLGLPEMVDSWSGLVPLLDMHV